MDVLAGEVGQSECSVGKPLSARSKRLSICLSLPQENGSKMAAADCCHRPAPATAFSSPLSLFLRVVVVSLLFIWGDCLNLGCQQVKIAYKEKGFDENDVPMQAISGEYNID